MFFSWALKERLDQEEGDFVLRVSFFPAEGQSLTDRERGLEALSFCCFYEAMK